MNRQGIVVIAYPDTQRGGCNFCDRHITECGMRDHAVIELSGGGLLARICRACSRELLPHLCLFARSR